MKYNILNLILLSSTLFWSYLIVIASKITIPFFTHMYNIKKTFDVYDIIPPITAWALNYYFIFITIICCLYVISIILSKYIAGHQTELQVKLLAFYLQAFISWLFAFCIFFDSFTGFMCLHHGPYFDPGNFLKSFWGVFPASLILIVVPIIIISREIYLNIRDHNKKILPSA